MEFTPRNFLIKDISYNYSRLKTHHDQFNTGTRVLEIQGECSKDQMAYFKENHIPFQEKDGKCVVSLKRKEFRSNGDENGPVRVVDGNNQPLDPSIIGNGSKGNAIVYQMQYDTAGRKGIFNSLTAVQITDLVEYTGGANNMEFDIVGGGTVTPTESASNDADLF